MPVTKIEHQVAGGRPTRRTTTPKSPQPMTPVMNTGLRPIRSDSAPNIGMVKMAMKLEISDSHNMAGPADSDPVDAAGGEGEPEHAEQGADGGDDGGEEDAHQTPPVVAEQHLQRDRRDGAFFFLGLEGRGFVQGAADQVADQDDDALSRNGTRQPQLRSCCWEAARTGRQYDGGAMT